MEEMVEKWYAGPPMVPPNDAPLFGVLIDGKKFEKNMNFEDFVTTLIVEGGYVDDEF